MHAWLVLTICLTYLLIHAWPVLFSRRFQSLTGQETINISAATTNGPSSGPLQSTELELLKQEILSEMRVEIQQAKQDIIEGENLLKSGLYGQKNKTIWFLNICLKVI